MHVKRIYARTVREALASAREQLGEAALVLSTELVPAPGWRGWAGQRLVRLTAATERGAASEDTGCLKTPGVLSVSADRPAVPAGRPARPDLRAGAVARLTAAGISEALSGAVAGRLTDAEYRDGGDHALRRALTAELESLATAEGPYARYEVFIGPPGVGKTTTIAKIAAQECAMRGARLGLVAADAFRAGAIEQLRSYAIVMGVPLRVARSADELEQALAGSRTTSLIDTAGRSMPDETMNALFHVLQRKRGVRTHVVLAADTSAATARRLLDRYAPLKPARVVITKLDETDSMMPLFDAVHERGLPISYLGTGQRVPDDLRRATPAELAAVLLREPSPEAPTCH